MNADVEFLLIYILTGLSCIFEEMSVHVLYPVFFLIGVSYLVFLLLDCGSSYVFWILISYQIHGLQIFLPFCGLPFNFVDGFFCCTEAFCFDVVPLVFFGCLCFRCHIHILDFPDIVRSNLLDCLSNYISLHSFFQVSVRITIYILTFSQCKNHILYPCKIWKLGNPSSHFVTACTTITLVTCVTSTYIINPPPRQCYNFCFRPALFNKWLLSTQNVFILHRNVPYVIKWI